MYVHARAGMPGGVEQRTGQHSVRHRLVAVGQKRGHCGCERDTDAFAHSKLRAVSKEDRGLEEVQDRKSNARIPASISPFTRL
ncbi:MAG: hypothetical protein IPJ87_15245 [Flavobacteriales bacterium]|nr:hypothetical protein [Flavobacteriales bacterium]